MYLLIFILCTALAAPQGGPDTEVEFVPVEELPALDEPAKKDPVVIVINPSSFLPRLPQLPRIPDLGDFPVLDGFGSGIIPNFGDFPRLPELFPDQQIPRIGLGEIFGNPDDEEDKIRCGLVCKVFKTLEGQLKGIHEEVDGLKSIIDGKFDHHNSTFDEKVLPDGSVIRVNKTTIHDSDDDGNGFFFHSAVHHVVNDGKNNETIPELSEDIGTVGETTVDNEAEILDIFDQDEKENEIEVDQKLPPNLSEVVDKKIPKKNSVGLVE